MPMNPRKWREVWAILLMWGGVLVIAWPIVTNNMHDDALGWATTLIGLPMVWYGRQVLFENEPPGL